MSEPLTLAAMAALALAFAVAGLISCLDGIENDETRRDQDMAGHDDRSARDI